MNRKEQLNVELEEQYHKLCTSITENDPIGTLVFWSDDYGANLFFSKWKIDENPWSIKNDNTIDIDSYEDEWEELSKDVEDFFSRLLDNESLSKLSLRQGFQCAIVFGDDDPSAVGKAFNGVADPVLNLEKSIDLCSKYTAITFEKAASSPIEKLVFSSEEGKSVIELHTVKHLSHEANEYNAFSDFDLGLAMTKISKDGDEAFTRFCEKIVQSDYFQDFPKRKLVVLYMVPNGEEYFAMVYETENSILRPLDDNKELALLYGILDDFLENSDE
jgi:hypothetical protein